MQPPVVFIALVVTVGLVGNGLALLCRNCISSKGFDECELMGEVKECNATIVNANHNTFRMDNPTLPIGNETTFKCYRIGTARLHANGTDSGLRGYARGCTFNSTNFCSGWVSSLNVTSCGTCTTNNCDQNPVAPTIAPTVAPVITTTTKAPGVISTTHPSAIATTTKKHTGGAGTILHIGSTTLTVVGVLVVLAGR